MSVETGTSSGGTQDAPGRSRASETGQQSRRLPGTSGSKGATELPETTGDVPCRSQSMTARGPRRS